MHCTHSSIATPLEASFSLMYYRNVVAYWCCFGGVVVFSQKSVLSWIVAIVFSVMTSGSVQAAPWIEPGDTTARRDVELLAAHGYISGPTISWPLPWSEVAPALAATDAGRYPHIEAAIRRLRAKYRRDVMIPLERVRVTVEAEATSSPQLVRGFESPSRDYGEARIGAETTWRGAYFRANIGADREVGGDTDLHFDGSYAAYGFGNVLFHIGMTEHWWGPGRDGALQLTNNARPFPLISATRIDPRPFETPLLSWLGPWRLTGFAGVLTDDRAVDNPFFAGMRAEIEPLNGLQIGLTRTMQFCGNGVSCGAGDLFDTVIGADNNPAFSGNARGAGSSDQKAGIDAKFSTTLGAYDAEVYGEIAGEDQAGFFPSKNAYLLGAGVGGPIGDEGDRFHLYGEYANTAAAGKNIFYNSGLYPSGNTHDGEVIGHSIESDGQLYTLGGSFEDVDGWGIRARVGIADLNQDGTVRSIDAPNSFPNAKRLGTLDVAASVDVLEGRGTLGLGASYVTDNINSGPRARDQVGGSVSLSLDF